MEQAIIRLVVLGILLLNQVFVTFGFDPIPYGEQEVYEGVSSVATVAAAIWAWWKNNNVSDEAKESQRELDEKKRIKKANK